MLTIKKILKEIGNKNLDLNRWDEGYYTFTFESDDDHKFEQHSVYTHRLNNLTLEQWVAEAHEFLEKIGEL